ncbi:hypothetical protein [Shewanella phaeophyticola]|uniref:Uncharacterized protein n=1 Tax=Shewanella phaeophyticola TaxID=2978345 RepID=A0ABT2NZC4_9GAMM|nr:hypothetical protein [Shewanella sp. KJ10-1]MCT8985739.1 hypothetical protein [Shewanella sp. KJ10-1]
MLQDNKAIMSLVVKRKERVENLQKLFKIVNVKAMKPQISLQKTEEKSWGYII